MEDERLAKIESEKQNAINNASSVYQTLNNQATNLHNQQMEAANTYETTQNDILDKQLAHQEQMIQQQKDVAKRNYETEANKARNDFQAYTNPYGVRAENLAARGLQNSGLSETSQLGGYNAYQNRVAAANKVLQDAYVAYDNDINEARLNNDVSKAQNALTKLQMQLQYSQTYYDTTSDLAQRNLANEQDLSNTYFGRYQSMMNQIQSEKELEENIRQYNANLAEKQRQYNESLAYQRERDRIADQQWEREFALNQQVSRARYGGGSGGSGGGGVSVPTGTQQNPQSKGVDMSGYEKLDSSKDLISAGMSTAMYNASDGMLYKKNGRYYIFADGEPVDVTKFYNDWWNTVTERPQNSSKSGSNTTNKTATIKQSPNVVGTTTPYLNNNVNQFTNLTGSKFKASNSITAKANNWLYKK
jgi:hypothetical protein